MALMAGMILLSVGTTVALTPTFAAGSGGGMGGGGGRGGGGAGSGRDGSAGSWSDSGFNTCSKGYIYVVKKCKCMRMKTEAPTDDELTDYFFALAKA
jgi:hypothetical protein